MRVSLNAWFVTGYLSVLELSPYSQYEDCALVARGSTQVIYRSPASDMSRDSGDTALRVPVYTVRRTVPCAPIQLSCPAHTLIVVHP